MIWRGSDLNGVHRPMDYQSKTIMRLRAELRAAQETANELYLLTIARGETWSKDQLPFPHAYPPIDAKQRADQIAAGQAKEWDDASGD